MKGRELVYHLADSSSSGRVTSEHDHWRINVLGTRYVMQAAMDEHVRRVVHCSTARVHGDTGRSAANEESEFRPSTAYELSKMQAERLALLFGRECSLPVAIARPTWTYGADDRRFRRIATAEEIDGDIGALVRERQRDGFPDSPRPAGNDCNSPG